MKHLVYDIEVFPNFFCACFEDYWTDKTWYFEISPWRDDREEMMELIIGAWLMGYNSLDYDDVVINYIMIKPRTVEEIYQMSQTAIRGEYKDIKRYKF